MYNNEFSQRLLSTLKQKKISQTSVAGALNLSRTAVNKWTRGGMIDDENLERLAQFLQVDKIWLKYGSQDSGTTLSPSEVQKGINELHIIRDSADIVTWEWDLLTDTVSYSDNLEKVYGVILKSNQDFWDLMSEADRKIYLGKYEKIMKSGGAHEIDFKINRDGEYRWITSRATGIRDHNGKITKIVGISLDNTERKKAEIELVKVKQLFHILLAHASPLTVFTDEYGEIIESNHASYHFKSGATSFIEIQTMIYNFLRTHQSSPGPLTEQAEYPFEGKVFTVYRHAVGKQVYLMFEISGL